MAKKKSKKASTTDEGDENDGQQQEQQEGAADAAENEEGAKEEPFQVELGDIVKVKQVLDETVAIAIADHLPEDFYWDNVKLWMYVTLSRGR
jgi:hypothetical protein